jgi:hypothetical protein
MCCLSQGCKLDLHNDHQKDKAESNPSRLGKEVLHEFKHKVKLKATRGNLMNLLNLAKIQ